MRPASDGLDEVYGPAHAITSHAKVHPQALLDYLAALGDDGSMRTIARRLGLDPAMMCRPWSLSQADKYATALGLHPGEVWGADYLRPGWREAPADEV